MRSMQGTDQALIHYPQNEILSKIFYGLESGFSDHFQAESIIQILLNLNNACIGWNSCDNTTFTKQQIAKQAQNVNHLSRCMWKLSTLEQKERDIFMKMSLRLVEDCQEFLRNIKPDLILRGWRKRLTSGNERHKKQYIQKILYYFEKWGYEIYQKYGQKIATQLISEEIATGKVFQGKDPHRCKEKEVVDYLLAAGKEIISKDVQLQQEEETLRQEEFSIQPLF